jgi:hypothetical protein
MATGKGPNNLRCVLPSPTAFMALLREGAGNETEAKIYYWKYFDGIGLSLVLPNGHAATRSRDKRPHLLAAVQRYSLFQAPKAHVRSNK